MGSEYASGGGGCVSTVEDYIKFLEAVRIGYIILKKDTIKLMAVDRLNDKMRPNWVFTKKGYGYGLGVRCPKEGGSRTDFGWSGAAGSYLAIDPVHNVTLFYVQHVLNSPNTMIKSQVYDFAIEDLYCGGGI